MTDIKAVVVAYLMLGFLLSGHPVNGGQPGDNALTPARPAMATTPPRGTWVAEGSIGVGQHWQEETTVSEDGATVDSGYDAEVVLTDSSVVVPSLALGVTDRLHVGIFSPGVAYRFGKRGRSEWIPFFSSALGFGYSTIEGAIIGFQPRIGLSAFHWLNASVALNWTVFGGSVLSYHSETASQIFERGSFGLRLGVVIHIGDRFTLAPSMGVGALWDRVDKDVGPPTLAFLGASPNALWQNPLFRVHVNNHFAVGLNLAGFVRTDTSAFGWNGGVNLIALW